MGETIMANSNHRDTYAPKDVKNEMEIIADIYRERINNNPSQGEIEALGEYHRMVDGRKLDGFEWVVEAIMVTSKKEPAKRNIPYFAGMIRKWLVHGFGYIPTQEEEMVAQFIEDDFGITLNRHARNILQEVLGKYGALALTRTVTKEGKDIDLSVGVMLAIKNHLEYNTNFGGHHNDENSDIEGQVRPTNIR